MYKIMFVDDDALIIRRLHQVLDWKSLGFEILPDAPDGLIALQLIPSDPPDVIICDINMPNMDGLSLTAKIKECYPQIQCILLTVNDSFGCAQQALNMGVIHYLLKPIEPAKLKKLILKVLEQLNSSRKQADYINALHDKAILNERMIRDKFLNWLGSGRQNLDEKQIKEKFRFYQIPLESDEFQMISIHINTPGFHEKNGKILEELMQTVTKSMEDTLSDYPNCVIFADSFYQFNVLIGIPSDSSMPGPSIEYLCHLLKDGLLFNLNLPVTVFYSRRYKGAANIYRCYYDTKFLSKYTSSIMDRGILSFDEYMQNAFDSDMDLDAVRTFTFRGLRSGDMSKLSGHLHTTLAQPFSRGAFDTFSMLRIDFVMTGLMFLQENKLALQDIFDRHYAPLADIMELNQPDECIDFLEHYYGRIIDYIQSSKVSTGRRISEKCIELIEQNIASQELSVKWLSTQIYINENYLSRLFRKEMNMPLVKYIMQKRMDTARDYLNQGYTNLQQVSRMTGFSDPLYFSKCFKKHFGIAPSQYK